MIYNCPNHPVNTIQYGATYRHGVDCRICWVIKNTPGYSAAKHRPNTNCINLLDDTKKTVKCNTCAGSVNLKIYSCKLHNECTIGKQSNSIACCATCRDYTTVDTSHELLPVDSLNRDFLTNMPAFNSSIIEYKGKVYIIYRTGWQGAKLHISEFDIRYNTPVGGAKTLYQLGHHPMSNYGQEDPRLFIHDDVLYVSYSGISQIGNNLNVNVLYARLNDRLQVEEIFYPEYQYKNSMEKNWVFFSHNNMLFCIYESHTKHVILRVIGNKAYPFAHTDNIHPWHGGYMRGGCSPILHKNVWYHFFHGRYGEWSHGVYNVGVYTFENAAPFRIIKQTSTPIVVADMKEKAKDKSLSNDAPAAIFPGGVVYDQGVWRIACGVNDRACSILSITDDELNKALNANDSL